MQKVQLEWCLMRRNEQQLFFSWKTSLCRPIVLCASYEKVSEQKLYTKWQADLDDLITDLVCELFDSGDRKYLNQNMLPGAAIRTAEDN
jgi:hypothetical protein